MSKMTREQLKIVRRYEALRDLRRALREIGPVSLRQGGRHPGKPAALYPFLGLYLREELHTLRFLDGVRVLLRLVPKSSDATGLRHAQIRLLRDAFDAAVSHLRRAGCADLARQLVPLRADLTWMLRETARR